jgi:hypothetical protein
MTAFDENVRIVEWIQTPKSSSHNVINNSPPRTEEATSVIKFADGCKHSLKKLA